MKGGNYTILQKRPEVNEQVAAAHQVKVGEGWILNHIVPGKNAQVANRLIDLISPVYAQKETLKVVGRNVGHPCFGVQPIASLFQSGLADIRGKNLNGLAGGGYRGSLVCLLP